MAIENVTIQCIEKREERQENDKCVGFHWQR